MEVACSVPQDTEGEVRKDGFQEKGVVVCPHKVEHEGLVDIADDLPKRSFNPVVGYGTDVTDGSGDRYGG